MKDRNTQVNPSEQVRFTLRLSRRLINIIDNNRKSKEGYISRNTWIAEYLERLNNDN